MPMLAVMERGRSWVPIREGRLQLCKDPRRHEAAPRREPVVLDQDHELVAAQASDGVALSHRVLQPVAHGLEELVADGVAEGVVHILEVVEIDDEHGRYRAAATGACEQLVGAVEDEPAVWEPGQLVVQPLSDQLVRLLVDEVERAGSRRAEREDQRREQHRDSEPDEEHDECLGERARTAGSRTGRLEDPGSTHVHANRLIEISGLGARSNGGDRDRSLPRVQAEQPQLELILTLDAALEQSGPVEHGDGPPDELSPATGRRRREGLAAVNGLEEHEHLVPPECTETRGAYPVERGDTCRELAERDRPRQGCEASGCADVDERPAGRGRADVERRREGHGQHADSEAGEAVEGPLARRHDARPMGRRAAGRVGCHLAHEGRQLCGWHALEVAEADCGRVRRASVVHNAEPRAELSVRETGPRHDERPDQAVEVDVVLQLGCQDRRCRGDPVGERLPRSGLGGGVLRPGTDDRGDDTDGEDGQRDQRPGTAPVIPVGSSPLGVLVDGRERAAAGTVTDTRLRHGSHGGPRFSSGLGARPPRGRRHT